MRLHWSPRSPFVRKVLITAHETGHVARLELVRSVAAMTRPNAQLMLDNPLSKLPTLVLDDGTSLYDSTVICEYLDCLDSGVKRESLLFPREGRQRWDALRRNALGSGLLDVLILWRNERERPPVSQSSELMAAFAMKVHACMRAIETQITAQARFDIGDIACYCALAYSDFRFPAFAWRSSYPHLAAWSADLAGRPSIVATEIADDSLRA